MKPAKNKAGLFDYSRKLPVRLIFIASVIFLYAPIIVLIVFSFNNSRRGGNVIWKGFTTDYYVKAFQNSQLIEAFGNSLTIAFISTIISVILGVLAALVLWRFRFGFKPVFDGIITLPIVIPEICMGVSLAMFFTSFGLSVPPETIWPFNLTNIIIGHITFSFPFAAMIIRSRLNSFNPELDNAARDLGGGEWEVFRDTILPHLKPALIASTLLCFTLSLDDFVITFFTSGPDTVTFPIKVYSMVRFSVTPEVNAASTILILITLTITAIAIRFQNAGDKD